MCAEEGRPQPAHQTADWGERGEREGRRKKEREKGKEKVMRREGGRKRERGGGGEERKKRMRREGGSQATYILHVHTCSKYTLTTTNRATSSGVTMEVECS